MVSFLESLDNTMARLKKRLFGDGPILDEVLSSIAYGFGVPGASVVERRKAAEDQQDKARRMQREGASDQLKQQEFDLKKQVALGGQAAPMDLAAMLSNGVSPEYAALSGMTPPVAGGQAVPSPTGGLGEELMGGSPLASIPMQRDAADLPPNGELPPPVRSIQDQAYDYLDQFDVNQIRPEKQTEYLQLKGIADAMKDATTEQGRMELQQQFQEKARSARLEKAIIPPPPTAQEELQTRSYVAPDGVTWTQQPTKEGGTRLESDDAPAKIQLEREKLQQEDLKYRTETEIRLKEAMDKARAEDETRKKESESMAAQQKADQKKKADEESRMELHRNYDSWNESAMKRKPREDRMEAARKKIDADFKSKKLPYTHRDLPPQYIDNMVDKELDTEFQDYLRGVERNKVRIKNSVALSPQQELERLAESDPDEWQKKFDQTKRELGESGEDVSDPMVVINAMEESVANTPARLMAKRKEAQLAEALRLKQASEREDAVTTSPSDAIPARRLEPLAEGVEGASSPADWVRRMGSQRTAPQASDAESQPQMTEPIGTDAIAKEPVLQGTEATAQDVQGNPLLRNLFGGQAPQAGQGGEQTLADMIRAEAGLPSVPRPEPAANPLREAPAEVVDKETKKAEAIPRLLKNASSGKDKRTDGKYIQDIMPAEQEKIVKWLDSGDAKLIVNDADYEDLAPGQIGIDADTGKMITRPVLHPTAEFIRRARKGGAALGMAPEGMFKDTAIITSQEQFDDLKEGDPYMNGFDGQMRIKRGKTFVKKPRTVGDEVTDYVKQLFGS